MRWTSLLTISVLIAACASNTGDPRTTRRDTGPARVDAGPIGGDEDAGPIGGDEDAGPIGGDEDAGPIGGEDAGPPEVDAGRCEAELCNRRDDDCDGMADEDFAGLGDPCTVGVGDCETTGTNQCAPDGRGVECDAVAGTPGTETCNGFDDDCDGMTDEMLGGITCGMGSCERTVPACVGGVPQMCTPGTPGGEVCNGADDDCDGMTDEMIAPITCGMGACMRTAPGCMGGRPGTCTPGMPAASDGCPANGVDDDCNGTTDEDCPRNDDRTSAISVTLGSTETVVMGNNAGATRDGPTVACACTSMGNVWYTFTLATAGVVYIDTLGSARDTSLFLTNSTGALVPAQPANGRPDPGLCNDDGGCGGVSGFTATESRTWGYLGAGTYYVSVSGCSLGAFTLRFQYLPSNVGSYFYSDRISGMMTTSTVLVGTSAQSSACGGTASGEDVRWFVTCGGDRHFFSLCRSDGGNFQRREGAVGTTLYDPSAYVRSAQTGAEVTCNDDGMGMGGTDCRGYLGTDTTMLDTLHYGSRLNDILVPRGVGAVFIDGRVGMSGMNYQLAYTVRN